ncbi:hypothetical protein EDD17DRAFT_1666372 [Pisolithus thermaeus]|nr:hypothetical protein EV401DRAFT_1916551 [Pisolithus croceorrhizus]KAI6141357.1 hypothetical protein EDD17DRAFT_1666372 [Pisolithus thermaeus]
MVPNGWSARLLCSWTCRGWLATQAAYSSAWRFALAWTRSKFRGHMRYCRGSKRMLAECMWRMSIRISAETGPRFQV